MKKVKEFDFKNIDWDAAAGKIDFFYDEAVAYNNAIIADIHALYGKWFSLLRMSLPVLLAAIVVPFVVRGGTVGNAIELALAVASRFFSVVVILSLVFAITMKIASIKDRQYNNLLAKLINKRPSSIKEAKLHVLHSYTMHNQRVMRWQGRLLMLALAAAIAAPALALIVFFVASRN